MLDVDLYIQFFFQYLKPVCMLDWGKHFKNNERIHPFTWMQNNLECVVFKKLFKS